MLLCNSDHTCALLHSIRITCMQLCKYYCPHKCVYVGYVECMHTCLYADKSISQVKLDEASGWSALTAAVAPCLRHLTIKGDMELVNDLSL